MAARSWRYELGKPRVELNCNGHVFPGALFFFYGIGKLVSLIPIRETHPANSGNSIQCRAMYADR